MTTRAMRMWVGSVVAMCIMLSARAGEPQTRLGREKTGMAQTISLDGNSWRLAVDPADKGRAEKWHDAVRPDARPATVPCAIQEVVGTYAGVAWYWHGFTAPASPTGGGRFLLRFWKVDYKADVWLNGKLIGTHEDGDEPFVLDATDAMKPGAENLLAVRVLNPSDQRIDGITRKDTVCGIKNGVPAQDWNFGGILDSVELLVVPPVFVEDLHLCPDWTTGDLAASVNVRNTTGAKRRVRLATTAAPAASGETSDEAVRECEVPPGDTPLKVTLRVRQHRLWDLDDPFLYRVTARLEDPASGGVSEKSDRCGFRDFRFADGYFRLNGRRILLRSAHVVWTTPVMIHSARDRATLRKDILHAKEMGFNAIRYLPYAAPRVQLDLADELGIMMIQQSMSSWCVPNHNAIADERFDRSLLGIVRRDRNHPSITAWYFLNEVKGPVVDRAVAALTKVRDLDERRFCLLNSGRWDGRKDLGSGSNPGSRTWDAHFEDVHTYPSVPHDAAVIHALRGGGSPAPLFLSEYGIGAALDLSRLVRQFEQIGSPNAMDARYYRSVLDKFMADWDRWKMAEVFGRPEDYFHACQKAGAGYRTLGLNAIRSNPALVGYSMTGLFDHVGSGEGPITMFRDLKPGHLDAMRDGWSPLRWCLFVEPCQVYRGGSVHVEAVLANEDAIVPGEYEVEVVVLDPDQKPAFRKTVKLTIADAKSNPAFALPVLAEDIKIDGPAGRYRLAARFIAGAAPTGRPVEFFVADPAAVPAVKADVALWGEDTELQTWLGKNGIAFHPLTAEPPPRREVILLVGKGGDALSDLARRIARGSTAVLVSPVPWPRWPLFTDRLVALDHLAPGLYHRDDWARWHPIFDGLPCGGLLDWTFYRNIVPQNGQALAPRHQPDEVVCAGINTICGYKSGIYVGIHKFGAGRFIANALNIRGNLGRDPVAERLLRNILNYAAGDLGKPPADLPADFDKQLKTMGY